MPRPPGAGMLVRAANSLDEMHAPSWRTALDAFDQDLRRRAVAAKTRLASASGLRAEELIGLELHSVEFDSETVRVEGKGGRTRLVPVGEHALRAIERYLARGRPALDPSGERALFLSKSGRRLGTSDV